MKCDESVAFDYHKFTDTSPYGSLLSPVSYTHLDVYKRQVSRVFWTDDLKYRVVGDEPLQRFSVGVGYSAVPRGVLGI